MTTDRARRHIAITVGQRLFLGLLPSLLAVALVVALAYWGEYGRTAPEVVVAGAAVLAVVSLGVTWSNMRYLSARIARLAGTGTDLPAGRRPARGAAGAADELDRIEQVVEELGSALSASESERARAGRAAEDRLRTNATMLSATARSAIARLDEVRLPLHILLEARFGELNENQEELLGAARDAADAMDGALRRLTEVADADRGALAVRREAVQVNDVVRGVVPLAHAAAGRRGGRADVALEPGLPRVPADRVRLAEALALLLEAAAEAADGAQPVVLSTARDGRRVVIRIAPAPAISPIAGDEPEATTPRDVSPSDVSTRAGPLDPSIVLAARLVEAQGGTVRCAPGDRGGSTFVLELPAAEPILRADRPTPGEPG